MNDQPNSQEESKRPGFARYASQRMIIVAVLVILVVWAFAYIPEFSAPDEKGSSEPAATLEHGADGPGEEAQHETQTAAAAHSKAEGEPSEESADVAAGQAPHTSDDSVHTGSEEPKSSQSMQDAPEKTSQEQDIVDHQEKQPGTGQDRVSQTGGHEPASHEAAPEPVQKELPTGVAFVNAAIAPLQHELDERFWGWRPNDVINFTDNVNNFQLGALEVTRRTVVMLAERISRTGSTDSFNPHLENAMNWLMVKADRYWFPAPESKYKESLQELAAYREELIKNSASFYTRTDNLIPLLSSYEDLLGSSDENLVKQKNEDGSDVSLYKADDYFFYAKGVASTMANLLEAIHHDFLNTLESRHAVELLHHALESCRQASKLDPLLITDGDLDGILANHRANMAAPISHARFYIGQLIKTLST